MLFAGCGGSETPSATDKAIDELQQKYQDLTEDGIDESVQWATEDLKKIGDWEYRVLDVPRGSTADLEAVLNEAGAERWEVIWMEPTANGHAVVMKRPAISYLSRIPLSQIGRFVIPGESEPQE